MPRPVDYYKTRDIKADPIWQNIRIRLSSRFKAAGMSEPSYNVVTLITLGLEHYVKALLSLTTASSHVRLQAQREVKEETQGRNDTQEDLMDIDEVATTDQDLPFYRSLAGIYGDGDPMELCDHRHDGVIGADDLLAVGDVQSRMFLGQNQMLRMLNSL